MSSRKQYPFNLIEPKWQQFWEEQQSFRAFNPGEVLPSGHAFAKRHGLEGKKVSAADLPPKYYILDMFPYPSGAGLHVGHPEGYTATDILARYKRAAGLHVLHPMGWDAFGLPAEQYAIKTGQHPRQTTEANIANFTKQIKSLGFSYDWTREVDTTDPKYFRWTQWIFLKLYNSWFNPETNQAEPIETLKYPAELESAPGVPPGSASDKSSGAPTSHAPTRQDAGGTSETSRRAYRASKRLAFVMEAPVWWCEQLGTVLANEEVVDGKSEVGGFPVVRKPMRQWMLRITAFAEKLLADLDTIDWSDSLKEMQRNWIGKSEGAEVDFEIADCGLRIAESDRRIQVFTTRPDTLFGATYMVLAPEHRLVEQIFAMADRWAKFVPKVNEEITAATVTLLVTNASPRTVPIAEARHAASEALQDLIETDPSASPPLCRIGSAEMFRFDLARRAKEINKQRQAVKDYCTAVTKKSDLERTELAKDKSGVFTGAYAINPVHGGHIPIWIADYVLASYGTGAIMAVPGHDTRDFEFAQKFNLPVIQVVQPPDAKTDWQGFTDEGTATNSVNEEFSLDGLPTAEAKKKITAWLETKGLGEKTINYKLRDWLFSRQRYWGEPFPIVWKKDANGTAYHEALPESALPLLPPALDDYKPTPDGQPPLARAQDWVNLPDGSVRETNTMPQWAGSCWYYLRYLDARRDESFCGTLAEHYWMGGPTEGLLLRPEQWAARLSELFAYANSHPSTGKQYITYGVVGEAEAARLQAATGLDVSGYRRFVDDQAISHILAEHGDARTEAARGQFAVTLEDLLLIPEVVMHPDRIVHDRKSGMGLEAILYEKRVNGFICCVEEVRGKNQMLAIKTFFKKKTTAAHASDGLDHTPETLRRSELTKAAAAAPVKVTPGVDLYVGGTEHAVLHLLYARFWHKVLFDLGYVSTPEPFFKLVNQGLILGEMEYYAFHESPTPNGEWVGAEDVTDITEVAQSLTAKNKFTGKALFASKVKDEGIEKKGPWFYMRTEGSRPLVRLETRCSKMSKSRGNVINPDDIISEYGADSLRLYEMFMGPLEMVKPWNTKGVEGVYRFLGRVWRMFVDEASEVEFEQASTTAEPTKQRELLKLIKLHAGIKDAEPTKEQLKVLHTCIKKVTEDLDGLRFNTAISAMMVFSNEAMNWETKPVSVLREFLILLQPFAPHFAEELWEKLSKAQGPTSKVTDGGSATLDLGSWTLDLGYQPWPRLDPALLVEDTLEIPVQVNGKLRDVIRVAATASAQEIESLALKSEKAQQFMAGKAVKKVIVVPKKLVNIVVG